MSRRVKNYWNFLNEGNALTKSKAAKTITAVIDPDTRRNIKRKSQGEIEQSKSKDGQTWAADTRYTYLPEEEGYVGWSKFHFGKVVLREIEEEGSTENVYEVLTGLNKGVKGPYEWQSGNIGTPIYNPPYGKKWADLLGPDEEFFNNYEWNSNPPMKITSVPGIEIAKVGNKGECQLIYTDKFQLYGKVKIYHDFNSDSNFSYEVSDGNNKGKKGKGFSFIKREELETKEITPSTEFPILNNFSKDGEIIKAYVKFPYPTHNGSGFGAQYAGSPSGKPYSIPSSSINPDHYIWLDTSEFESINSSSLDVFKSLYGDLKYKDKFGEKTLGSQYQEKSKYYWADIGSEIKGNKLSGSYLFNYLGSGSYIYLYSVNSKNESNARLKWDDEVGCFGNNFFTGLFITGFDLKNPGDKYTREYLKGEWFWDYKNNYVCLLYAYNSKGEKKSVIYNLDSPSEPVPYDKWGGAGGDW
jgi:hypothetical protein